MGGCVCVERGRRAGVEATRRTVTAGLVLTAATGLVAVLHGFALCLLLPLAATSPFGTSLARRFFRGPDSPPGSPPPGAALPDRSEPPPDPVGHEMVEPAGPDVRSLDDAALCLAWRHSFVRLRTARSVVSTLIIVEQRQRYLDELHRRWPQGVMAWYGSGGRASGNPLPYLGQHCGADPWEGLAPPDAGDAHV
jgi:hypothetical protein